MILNKSEIKFKEMMKSKGFELIPQPYLKKFKMRPDFYCPKTRTYYEVIGTRQAYHIKKEKIKFAIRNGLKVSVVHPDGRPYFTYADRLGRKKEEKHSQKETKELFHSLLDHLRKQPNKKVNKKRT